MRAHALAKSMNTHQVLRAHALAKVGKYSKLFQKSLSSLDSKPSFSERMEAHAGAISIAGLDYEPSRSNGQVCQICSLLRGTVARQAAEAHFGPLGKYS